LQIYVNGVAYVSGGRGLSGRVARHQDYAHEHLNSCHADRQLAYFVGFFTVTVPCSAWTSTTVMFTSASAVALNSDEVRGVPFLSCSVGVRQLLCRPGVLTNPPPGTLLSVPVEPPFALTA
jgi:hypothetical protein